MVPRIRVWVQNQASRARREIPEKNALQVRGETPIQLIRALLIFVSHVAVL